MRSRIMQVCIDWLANYQEKNNVKITFWKATASHIIFYVGHERKIVSLDNIF